MYLNGVMIEDTFAEAFPMRATRILITADTARWAGIAAEAMTGFATSVIARPSTQLEPVVLTDVTVGLHAPEPEPEPQPEPEPEPDPEPTPEPETLPEAEPEPEPEAIVEPVPEPAAEPVPEPEPAAEPASAAPPKPRATRTRRTTTSRTKK